MVTTSGKCLKAFYSDPACWPADESGRAHEGERIVVNGVGMEGRDILEILPELEDADVVEVHGGMVWGGDIDVNDEPSFECLLARWLEVHESRL